MPRGEHLNVEDWFEAGLVLLKESGSEGVKLSRLTAYLGVTTGSFYWHFKGIDDFHRSLLNYWIDWDTRLTAELAKSDNQPIKRLQEIIQNRQLLEVEEGVLDWSSTSTIASQAMRKVEEVRVNRTAEILIQMGLDAYTAKLRAQIFVWAGGRSHGADMQWRHDVLKHLVEIISPQETTGN